MMFPEDMRDWLPKNHLVHFIVDAVNQIGVGSFRINKRGTGDEQYPPDMMLALLIYSYATGRFGSRTIEAATYTDVAIRYICGGIAHPDHSVICAFRKDNKGAFEEAFTKILVLARQLKKLKKVGGHQRGWNEDKSQREQAQGGELQTGWGNNNRDGRGSAEADKDGRGRGRLEEGLNIPDELQRREDRQAAMKEARAAMEAMYKEAEEENTNQGKKLEEYQYNFTDSDSRIMKAGNGKHFEQSYNAQAAVDTEGSMLLLGGYVTQHVNDKQELAPAVGSVPDEVREADTVSADSGFYSEDAVQAVEKRNEGNERTGPEVFCAVEKGKHGRSVEDLKKKPPKGRPPKNMTPKEKMAWKLKTRRGSGICKKRKETVEPVFGIIKSVMGFRQFMLRGLPKVNTEWALVRTAYNFKRLYNLLTGKSLSQCQTLG